MQRSNNQSYLKAARIGRSFFLGALALCATACVRLAPDEERLTFGDPESNTALDVLAEDFWQWRLENDLYSILQSGAVLSEIPDFSEEDARRRVKEAAGFYDRAEAINPNSLSQDRRETRLFLQSLAKNISLDEEAYKYNFIIAPYSGGFIHAPILQYAAGAPLEDDDARSAYLTLINEYADLIDQTRLKTVRQAELGVRFPKSAIPGAVALFRALKSGAVTALTPSEGRLQHMDANSRRDFLSEIHKRLEARVVPAFDALLDQIGPAYVDAAPEAAGLSHYPGGLDHYKRLILKFTSHAYEPEELHAFGLKRMAEIRAEMKAVRDRVGFHGTQRSFHEKLRSDPRFIPASPEDIEERFIYHLERIAPVIPSYFEVQPRAPYAVKRLDPANEAGQAFGYYQQPSEADNVGYYRYNGSNLSSRSLVNAAALIYHELIPGHHFHIAMQLENDALPSIRKYGIALDLSAFREGWAEYAASLGYEMGLYDDPYDHYGQLIMESFLTSRLVVDTGLNALGWSLEEARSYMRDNTFLSEAEILAETTRYATDIPGQALAYKIGQRKITDIRDHAEEILGEEFDLRAFNSYVALSGDMPLDVLEARMNAWVSSQLGCKNRNSN